MSHVIVCRCCGGEVPPLDEYPIHTRCIPKHWDSHQRGIKNARCREFGPGQKPKCEKYPCNKYAPNTVTVGHGTVKAGGGHDIAEYERVTLCDDHARATFRHASRNSGVVEVEIEGPASANYNHWINR